jgi:anti-sigma B factor antagonist
MEITTKQLKRVDVVIVSGRVDSSTAPELDKVLRSITDAERFRICMDLKDLEYLSSAGIKVLISTLKTCKRWNRGELRLANLPPYIAEVFDLAGLLPLFKVYPDLVEAVGSF